MSQQPNQLQHVIDQMANLLLALTKGQADQNPQLTAALVGYAIEASKSGGSPELLIEIYQKTFPGKPLPVALPEEEFNRLKRNPAN